MTQAERYEAQLQAMLARCHDWRARHPDRVVQVQFNYPREVFLVTTISDALREGIVSCNYWGLRLVKALWPWNESEPTVAMVRVVIEHE
jgi:hypothetical protein